MSRITFVVLAVAIATVSAHAATNRGGSAAGEGAVQLVYTKTCNAHNTDCTYSNETVGCHADRLKGYMKQVHCTNRHKECVFIETYHNAKCTGDLKQKGLWAPCSYCKMDYGGGTTGYQYYCNSSTFWESSCDDYACIQCNNYNYYTLGECDGNGNKYVREDCGWLYGEQIFTPVCGDPENYGVGPLGFYPTPYFDKTTHTTKQCVPF
jgi:hypothetical protein